jgi:hypothetical protein
MEILQKDVKIKIMIDDDIIEISFEIYEKVLFDIYNNSSPKLSSMLESNIGLELIETDYEENHYAILKFKIIDKEKWFLSKIKYGF